MKVNYVRQEDQQGCVIACLAMLLGKTYQEAKELVRGAWDQGGEQGLSSFVALDTMAQQGYTYQFKSKYDFCSGEYRNPWPPRPFAPTHMVMASEVVDATRTHAVVLLADGTVLDPDRPSRATLDAFVRFDIVIGFWPIKKGWW